ncbi:MAG: glutamate---cysteine ligase / carboxylate-amine ligase [Solirubrobacteraceae bacterium]|nr:glutamate---cysteine ligase / carboxylate-amine ligase [Solirubrobacteraceae bacterium]
MTAGTGSPRFRAQTDLALGVEEELILVEPETRRLSHTGVEVLERMTVDDAEGAAHPDTYSALVELASPIVRDAEEGVAALSELRARLRAAGGVAIGAGIHPDGAFGDVEHVDAPRYDRIVAQLRGLIGRTPTCALHVHVGMADAPTAIRTLNALREHLPLLQALAANSPFWHGRDSGLDSARAQLFRGYPRAEIPRAFDSYDDYAETVAAVVAAGDLPDYTFLWWDVRPHPRLGTVEVRAMDAQSSLWSAAGLAALIHGLARAAVEEAPGPASSREALMEASFTAARDGLRARLPLDGSLRPAREVALAALERARPHARELGSEDALAGIDRILAEGNGADRQRAAFARGGMPALLDLLVAEAERPYR